MGIFHIQVHRWLLIKHPYLHGHKVTLDLRERGEKHQLGGRRPEHRENMSCHGDFQHPVKKYLGEVHDGAAALDNLFNWNIYLLRLIFLIVPLLSCMTDLHRAPQGSQRFSSLYPSVRVKRGTEVHPLAHKCTLWACHQSWTLTGTCLIIDVWEETWPKLMGGRGNPVTFSNVFWGSELHF